MMEGPETEKYTTLPYKLALMENKLQNLHPKPPILFRYLRNLRDESLIDRAGRSVQAVWLYYVMTS